MHRDASLHHVTGRRAPLQLGGRTLSISTSVGVAFTAAPRDADALVALADRALYAAKAAGRDGWTLLEAEKPVRGDTSVEEHSG
jgi:PleD family two-component response regulator